MLPVVLYDCETWSPTLREERRLRVFENRILRRIFGPKRDENGEWRRLHNEELHSLYCSPNIIRAIKSTSHVTRMEEGRSVFKILTGTPTGKIYLEGLDVNGTIVLELILKIYVSKRGTGLIRLRIGIIGEIL